MPKYLAPYWPHSDPNTPEPTPAAQHPSSGPCPGRCNSAWRAAEARRDGTGTPHTITPRAGHPVWCAPCTTGIRGAVGDMPELAVRLHLEIGAGTTTNGSDERVSGSRERALHEHQAAAFALEETAGFLADWEDTVRADRNLSPRTRGDRGHANTVAHSARFLLIHLAWLLTEHPEPDASEGFGRDLLALHRKAQAMTKTGEVRPERCEGVYCPNCDLYALEWEVDPDTGAATGDVRCRVCRPRFVMTPDEYRRWTRMLGHEAREQGYVTPQVLADAGLGR